LYGREWKKVLIRLKEVIKEIVLIVILLHLNLIEVGELLIKILEKVLIKKMKKVMLSTT